MPTRDPTTGRWERKTTAEGAPATEDATGNVFRRGVDRARGSVPKVVRAPRQPAELPRNPKNLSDGFAMLWGIGGGALAARGEPAGRLMRVQAPQAGREFNRWVRHHPAIYRATAPFLAAEGLTFVSKVIAPPLLVTLMDRRPELIPMLQPILLPMLFETFRELKREEVKQTQALEAMMDELGEESEVGTAFQAFLDSLGFTAPDETSGASEEPPSPPEDSPPEAPEAPFAEGVPDVAASIVGPPSAPAETQVG